MKLDKLLQSQGFGSRKHCQALIQQGTVTVQGQLINDPGLDVVADGLEFSVGRIREHYVAQRYIALYKPAGYECSQSPLHHLSVYELLPQYIHARGVQPVGRLDFDTTGLLLLSDDGRFIQRMTHPRHHVAKYYVIQTADPVTEIQLQQLAAGVALHRETGLFCASEISLLGTHTLRFAIHQGVYHQVKRMLAAVGHRVVALQRDQIGRLSLSELNLQPGSWCDLSKIQLELLDFVS